MLYMVYAFSKRIVNKVSIVLYCMDQLRVFFYGFVCITTVFIHSNMQRNICVLVSNAVFRTVLQDEIGRVTCSSPKYGWALFGSWASK